MVPGRQGRPAPISGGRQPPGGASRDPRLPIPPLATSPGDISPSYAANHASAQGTVRDKAELAGMGVALVDERGTSSTCPQCSTKVAKPKGRVFACNRCGHGEHRDVVGARNIAARGGGSTSAPALVTHRRAGRHLPGRTRRDPRRVRMDNRSGLWPAVARSEASESRSSSDSSSGEEPLTAAQRAER